jgi:hypothetical protein
MYVFYRILTSFSFINLDVDRIRRFDIESNCDWESCRIAVRSGHTRSAAFFVYILYVDESGDGGQNTGSSHHLVLAGVAIHEGQWKTFSKSLDAIQESYLPHAGAPVEFHASEIRGRRGVFRGFPKQQRDALMTDLYTVISRSTGNRLVLFATVVDKAPFMLKYGGKVDPYEGAFEGLCTMFNMFLQHLQKKQGKVQRGIVVFDEARPSLSRQIKMLLAKFQAGGARWTNMGNLIETVFFFDSRTSRIMQLADFTAYAIYRWYESGDDGYVKIIKPRFDHYGAKIHGTKCYPLGSTRPW